MGKKYNVVTIFLDTFREECLYNDKVIMPNLKNFIFNRCMNFTQIIPEALPTVPVRRSMFTCQRYFPHNVENISNGNPFQIVVNPDDTNKVPNFGWDRVPENCMTVAELMTERKYKSVYIGNTHVINHESFYKGFDSKHNFIYKAVEDLNVDSFMESCLIESDSDKNKLKGFFSKNPWLLNEDCKLEDTDEYRMFQMAIAELKHKPVSKPLYLHLDYFSLHQPYYAPKKYLEMYAKTPYEGIMDFNPVNKWFGDEYPTKFYSEECEEDIRNRYYAQCTMFDDLFGEFIKSLEEMNRLDDTIILIYSDHGICLGEYKLQAKPNNYNTPYVVKNIAAMYVPGWVAETNDKLFYNYDVMATLFRNILGENLPEGWYGSNVILDRGYDYVVGNYFQYLYYYDKKYLYSTSKDRTTQCLWDMENKKFIPVELNEIMVDEFYDRIMEDGGYDLPDLIVDERFKDVKE